MGEQLRSHIRACTAIHLDHRVFDIFRNAQRCDAGYAAVQRALERDDVPPGIHIFHVNGDEVQRVTQALERARQQFRCRLQYRRPGLGVPVYPKE